MLVAMSHHTITTPLGLLMTCALGLSLTACGSSNRNAALTTDTAAHGATLAILDFPSIPEVRKIAERRVGGAWKLLEPLDGILE